MRNMPMSRQWKHHRPTGGQKISGQSRNVPHPIPGLVGRVLLYSALGCSILIDFSILGYFCQLEFIHPSDIAICSIGGSRHSFDCKAITLSNRIRSVIGCRFEHTSRVDRIEMLAGLWLWHAELHSERGVKELSRNSSQDPFPVFRRSPTILNHGRPNQ